MKVNKKSIGKIARKFLSKLKNVSKNAQSFGQKFFTRKQLLRIIPKTKKSIIFVLGFFLILSASILVAASFTKVPVAANEITYNSKIDPCEIFVEKDLKCTVQWIINDTAYQGLLIDQSPDSGNKVIKKSDVTLTYSKGPELSRIPDVTGLTLEETKEKLYKLGFSVEDVYPVSAGGIEKDRVVSTLEKTGDFMKNGTSVTIYTSNGITETPDWTGKSKEYVQTEANNLNLKVVFVEEENEGASGLVLRQSPEPGELSSSEEITITISKAIEDVDIEIPNVIGMTAEDAQITLAVAGFNDITTIVIKNSEVTTTQVTHIAPNVGELSSNNENIVIVVSEPYK